MAERGDLLAVLPELAVETRPRAPLRRVGRALRLPPVELYAAYRVSVGPRGRAEAMVAATRAVAELPR